MGHSKRVMPKTGIIIYTLSAIGRCKKELVIIPAGAVVEPHAHPNVEKYIEPVFGRAVIHKGEKKLAINGFKHRRDYHIEAGEVHAIEVAAESAFVFISTQYWSLNNKALNQCFIEKDWISHAK